MSDEPERQSQPQRSDRRSDGSITRIHRPTDPESVRGGGFTGGKSAETMRPPMKVPSVALPPQQSANPSTALALARLAVDPRRP